MLSQIVRAVLRESAGDVSADTDDASLIVAYDAFGGLMHSRAVQAAKNALSNLESFIGSDRESALSDEERALIRRLRDYLSVALRDPDIEMLNRSTSVIQLGVSNLVTHSGTNRRYEEHDEVDRIAYPLRSIFNDAMASLLPGEKPDIGALVRSLSGDGPLEGAQFEEARRQLRRLKRRFAAMSSAPDAVGECAQFLRASETLAHIDFSRMDKESIAKMRESIKSNLYSGGYGVTRYSPGVFDGFLQAVSLSQSAAQVDLTPEAKSIIADVDAGKFPSAKFDVTFSKPSGERVRSKFVSSTSDEVFPSMLTHEGWEEIARTNGVTSSQLEDIKHSSIDEMDQLRSLVRVLKIKAGIPLR